MSGLGARLSSMPLWFPTRTVTLLVLLAVAMLGNGSGTDPGTDTYVSSWDSSPFNLESVTDNNLGLTAKACAQNFCQAGTNGLDLWISMEEVCAHTAQPYFRTFVNVATAVPGSSWNHVTVGLVCGLVGFGGMCAGFRWGTDFSAFRKRTGF